MPKIPAEEQKKNFLCNRELFSISFITFATDFNYGVPNMSAEDKG